MQTTKETFRCCSHRKALGCVGNKFWCCWNCLFGEKLHSSKFDPTPRPCSSRESIISNYRFLGVCMVKVEKRRQQLPIHGLRRGLILQPRRSWIQRSRQNGLQRRNGDYTMSARFPVKERILDRNKTEETKSNADNFKLWLFVDLFLRALWYCPPHVWPLCYLQTKGFQGRGRSQPKKEKGCIHVQWKSIFTPTMFSDHYWSFAKTRILYGLAVAWHEDAPMLKKTVSASGRRWWW